MDSLYGSNAAPSFVISNRFSSIEEMASAFSAGAGYTDVWYNEYCLIDTPNKNDKDNGKVYKRGLNYQTVPLHGAEYVGQIVGPSSGTPYFSIDTIPEAQKYGSIDLPEYWYRRYPTGKLNDEGECIGVKDDSGNYITTEESGTPGIFGFSKNIDTGLVPGKEDDGSFNDEIRYTWVNIRADTAAADSWYYVGMSIPYTVIDYQLHSVSPYYDDGLRNPNPTTMDRIDDKSHPFYEEWDMGVAHGIKGDALRNLRIITPKQDDVIYSIKNLKIDSSTGEASFETPGYDGQADDIAKGRQILVFDYYKFDRHINPTTTALGKYTVYLGPWNIISNLGLKDDGTFWVTYTYNEKYSRDKLIRWVTDVELTSGDGSAGGLFTMKFNNDNPYEYYRKPITWIKNIEIDAVNGDATFTYAGTGYTVPAGAVYTDKNGSALGSGKYRVPHLIKWVKDVELDTETGHFQMDFNDDTSYNSILNWVKDITIDESNGDITINHTTGDVKSAAKLKLLTRMATSEDGVITLYFNTGETMTVTNLSGGTYKIKMVTNISLATGINDDKHIMIKYNTESASTPIGDPINFIQDVVVRPTDFHLLVLYSDPSHRPSTDANGVVTYPSGTGVNDWVSNANVRGAINTSNIIRIPTYGSSDNTVYWRDYGSVKDDHGVLVGMNISYSDIEGQDILDYLNATYPNGITASSPKPGSATDTLGGAVAGKVVTYLPQTDNGKQDKEFYAFDYSSYSWYYLGSIGDNGMRDVVLSSSDPSERQSSSTKLNTQGLMFEYFATSYSDTAMPSFWDKDYNSWATE